MFQNQQTGAQQNSVHTNQNINGQKNQQDSIGQNNLPSFNTNLVQTNPQTNIGNIFGGNNEATNNQPG